MREEIPRKTVYRLSVYLRCLRRLSELGESAVSSDALAKAAGVKPAQLRKDLAHLGALGKRGFGYEVRALEEKLVGILGRTRLQPVILAGVGNLGAALMGYDGFAKEGFEILAGFDIDAGRAKARGGFKQPVLEMGELPDFVRRAVVNMAVLCVPGKSAQEVANQLVEAGIQAILNFSPILLQVPDEVMVNNVNLAIELENLSYFAKRL